MLFRWIGFTGLTIFLAVSFSLPVSATIQQSAAPAGSAQDRQDFGVSGMEVQSVRRLDLQKIKAETAQAARKGETWPREAILVALKFVGAGLKGHTTTIEVKTPPETQDTATITVTASGYLDDAVSGERWRLWLARGADGVWTIQRALWAQLCSRPGRRFYSGERCP